MLEAEQMERLTAARDEAMARVQNAARHLAVLPSDFPAELNGIMAYATVSVRLSDLVAATGALDLLGEVAATLDPWANYADPAARFPADFVVTKGSPLAKRQPTMGDCYRAKVLRDKIRGPGDAA